MSDPLVSTDQFDASKMALTGQRKLHSGLHGSPLHPLITRLEALGVTIPPGSGPGDLQRLLADAERKAAQTGDSQQSRLWARYEKDRHDALNELLKAKRLGTRAKDEPTPAAIHFTDLTLQIADEMSAYLHELQTDNYTAENTSPLERRVVLLERQNAQLTKAVQILLGERDKQYVDAHNALEKRVVVLEQRIDPTPNALKDKTLRVINGAD